MSNKKLGWAFSANRPVAVQSPSMMPLSDIQTRLNFSVSSPSTQAKKKSLISINRKAPSSGSSTPLRSMNNRLADYHMSKQNPDVLDRMHSTSTLLPTSPQNSFSSYGRQIIGTPHNSGPSSTNSSPGLPFQNSATHTPVQVSLLRQSLKASKGLSSSRSSLVQLATQRGSVRLNGGSTISPVVVRLSRGSETPPPVMLNDYNGPGLVSHLSWLANGVGGQEKVADPCDKDTVLTALRSKRKRWASSAIEESPSSVSLASGQPSAKRSKQTVQGTVEVPPSTGRKRPHKPVPMSQSLDTTKRLKIIKPIPKKANKICMPVIEYEPEVESSQTKVPSFSEGPTVVRSQANSNPETPLQVVKAKTSPVIPMDEDQEIAKKREDSLSKLKTVFPSAKSEKSMRRKVPVFCATGQKPHMPSPLSSTYSVTREDLLKDREAAAEKLNQLLSGDDHTDGSTSSVTKTDSKQQAVNVSSSASNLLVSNQEKSATQSTVVTAAKVDLSVSATLTGKTVSFASPIASSIPSTVTTQSTMGVSSSLLTGLTLQKPALQSMPIPATTENPVSSAPTLKSAGGGLSLPTVSFPSIAPSLTVSQVTVTSTQPSTLNQAPTANVISGGITIGAGSIQTTRPQFPTLNASTGLQSGSGASQPAKTEQNAQPAGLRLGIPNATVTNSGLSLGLTQSTASAPSLQTTLKPATATNPLSGLTISTSASTMAQTLKTPQSLSQLQQAQPSLNFGGQQQSGGGLSLGITPQTTVSLNTQQPSGGLMFGTSTASSTTTQQSTGLLFGNPSTTSTATQQSTGGLLFGNAAQTTQQSSSSLLFSNKAPTTAASTQPSSGLMFGNAAASTSQQTIGGGLSFGNNAATTSTPGLLFGDTPQVSQSSGGLTFGNNTTAVSQSSGGLMFGKTTTASNGTSSNQPSQSGGLMFGNKPATTSSGFSFTAGATQSTQNSMFGVQAPKEPAKPSGLLFGATTSQAPSSTNSFSFTAGGASQTSMLSGASGQQSLAFGNGQSQPSTQGTNSIFGGAMNSSAQKPLNSMFGGPNTTSQPQQSMNSGSSGFNFTAGASNPLQQKPAGGGQLNFGQTPQTGLNFGQSQSGNGTSTGFSFKPSTGMSMGQTASTGLAFGGGNSSNNALMNNGPGANIFKSPQPSVQPPGNTGSFQFTPQQPSTPQQGFNFSATATPSQPSFNFSATTPTPTPFTTGTPGDSASRSISRARRRGRKK